MVNFRIVGTKKMTKFLILQPQDFFKVFFVNVVFERLTFKWHSVKLLCVV